MAEDLIKQGTAQTANGSWVIGFDEISQHFDTTVTPNNGIGQMLIAELEARDEVSEIGGLGPCGRVCCCCSWQRRYPSKLAPDRRTSSSLPALMNGTCGRFKCCLAFERDQDLSPNG